MNIFILDLNQKKCAQYHNNKHVVKMVLESTQLLCTVHHLTGGTAPYKLSYKNHPCAIWTRKSLSNYNWLLCLAKELCYEYTYRYKKIHKSQTIIESLPIPNLKDIGLTDFAQAMPEEIKNKDAVVAYRNYYMTEKRHLAEWKIRESPLWFK